MVVNDIQGAALHFCSFMTPLMSYFVINEPIHAASQFHHVYCSVVLFTVPI